MCVTVRVYYEEMWILCEELESCVQPKRTDQQWYENLMFGLPMAQGENQHALKCNIKDNDYLSFLIEKEDCVEELRQVTVFESCRAVFVKKGKN